jgi:hypothetical protein
VIHRHAYREIYLRMSQHVVFINNKDSNRSFMEGILGHDDAFSVYD